jgi:sugar phosphate isomerase/epimerase
MRFALCNEVLASLAFERQCDVAAQLGYTGLEIAPFTLADAPHELDAGAVRRVRRQVEAAGLVVTSLHWLLVKPAGLSLTTPDAAVRQRTLDVMTRLVALCADLGGNVLVHGSPQQRGIAPGETHADAHARLVEALAAIAQVAQRAGVTYCLEPLSRDQTPLVNTVAEAAAIVTQVGSPALRTMIDCSSAGLAETQSVSELIDQWLPTGMVAHIQVNDPNRRAPGQGAMDFVPIAAALQRNRYDGTVAVEPFDYVPDGPGSAAFAAGYWRGVCAQART